MLMRFQSLTLVLAFMIRHHLSFTSASDLLKLIGLHLPKGTDYPTTQFKFKKFFDQYCHSYSKHIYCVNDECGEYIGQQDQQCPQCGSDNSVKANIKSGKYFITFDIKLLLKSVIESPALEGLMFADKYRLSNSLSISDICTGHAYKELRLGSYDITVLLNLDGVPAFKSSTSSFWPLFFTINELPSDEIRNKHVQLGGLWFGQEKPNFTTFLTPFIKDMKSLASDGINWTIQKPGVPDMRVN